MKFKYLVHIGWRQECEFDDPLFAMVFADTAAKHKTASSEPDTVSIDIISVDEPEPKPVSDPDETPVGGDDD